MCIRTSTRAIERKTFSSKIQSSRRSSISVNPSKGKRCLCSSAQLHHKDSKQAPRGFWKDENNQRECLERIGRQFGVQQLDDWYKVSDKVRRLKVSFIHNYYNDSLYEALEHLYPNHNWDPWMFSPFPKKCFADVKHQRKYLDKLGKELGVKQLDDWYKLSSKEVERRASFIDSRYNSSLYKALQHIYPEHNWDPLQFASIPKGYWKDEANQRSVLEKLGIELGVKKLDDWYKVSNKEAEKKASFIHSYYNSSLCKALQHLYPEHKWDPLLFSTPKGYWKEESNRRDWLDKIGKEVGVKQLDDWYRVPAERVRSNASFVCRYYNNSLYNALESLYPEHEWDPIRYLRVPRRFWADRNNQKKYLDRLGKELGVKHLDDWYNIPAMEVRRKASFVTRYYNGSLFQTLKTLYSTHKWEELNFAIVPRGFWTLDSTKQHFYELLMKWKEEYRIQRMRDWYHLPPKKLVIFQRACKGIFGKVTTMLDHWFPDSNWSTEVQSSSPEQHLIVCLMSVMSSDVCIQWMLRLVADVEVHQKIGPYSVDAFIPAWNVAIEYQGGQHQQQTWRGDLARYLDFASLL